MSPTRSIDISYLYLLMRKTISSYEFIKQNVSAILKHYGTMTTFEIQQKWSVLNTFWK